MLSGSFRENLTTCREYYVYDKLTLEIGIIKKNYYNASNVIIMPDKDSEVFIKILLNNGCEKEFFVNSKTEILFTEDSEISDIKLIAWQCIYDNIWESVKHCNRYISESVKDENYRGQIIIKGRCKVIDKVCRLIRLF
jgi:hypothetical protein